MIGGPDPPIPSVLGGAVAQTLTDTTRSLAWPRISTISRWDPALASVDTNSGKGAFHHVDVEACAELIDQTLASHPDRPFEPHFARQFAYYHGVTELVGKINPDVIQVHNDPALSVFLLRRFPGRHHVFYMHSDPGADQYCELRMPEICRGFGDLVFVSDYLARAFQSCCPDAVGRTTVIPNGVDTRRWSPRRRVSRSAEVLRRKHGARVGNTLLFVGRIAHRKGLVQLLDAFERVLLRCPRARLLIAGSPWGRLRTRSPFQDDLKRRAAAFGDRVRFTGYVEHDRTPDLYGIADVTVIPSVDSEGMPKVLLESLASGVPVVASRQGGIPEVVTDGDEGILVEDARDVDVLADALVRVLSDGSFRSAASDRARRTAVRRYSRGVRFRRLRRLYRRIERDLLQVSA